jgi:MFS family permease
MGGAFAYPALLPLFKDAWGLSNTEAGWIAGLYYAGNMLAVPVLMSLTDRLDARRIYVSGALVAALAMAGFALFAEGFYSAAAFWTLAGAGLAGTYMPGLRALVDRVPGAVEARAVAFYTASFSLGTALSFFAAGELAAAFGWRAAFVWGTASALAAAGLASLALGPVSPAAPAAPVTLLDFRPVFRNRVAMGYVLGYGMHTAELFAMRSWLVAFLGFSLIASGSGGGLAPTTVAMLSGLVAMVASVAGQELAVRFGRRRVIALAMAASMVMATGIGFAAPLPYPLVIVLALIYAAVVQADSAALTAGTVCAAEPGRRGATLAVHSVVGFSGAFLGPLVMGVTLDAVGGGSVLGWGLAFGCLAVMSVAGIAALWWTRERREGGA